MEKHTPGNTRLYPHKTNGGAEYLSPTPIRGTNEGSFDSPFLIRLDGRPEFIGPSIDLIAAAPELLEACKRALNILESEPAACGIYIAHQKIIRDAIAKAEGN